MTTYARQARLSYMHAAITVLVLVVLLTFCLLCTSCVVNGMGPTYSQGQRTGQLYKVSHKGVIWKSWECEMLLSAGVATDTMNGTVVAPMVWAFSCTDPQLGSREPML